MIPPGIKPPSDDSEDIRERAELQAQRDEMRERLGSAQLGEDDPERWVAEGMDEMLSQDPWKMKVNFSEFRTVIDSEEELDQLRDNRTRTYSAILRQKLKIQMFEDRYEEEKRKALGLPYPNGSLEAEVASTYGGKIEDLEETLKQLENDKVAPEPFRGFTKEQVLAHGKEYIDKEDIDNYIPWMSQETLTSKMKPIENYLHEMRREQARQGLIKDHPIPPGMRDPRSWLVARGEGASESTLSDET